MRLASTLAAAFGRLPGPVRAGLWMTAAAAAFGTMSGCINALAPEIHPLESAFFRSIIGTLLLAPWLLGTRRAVHKTNKHGLYFSRALASTVTQMGIFTGLTLMPMADAIALTFTAPLFGLLLAAPLLGERLHLRRIAATLIGFAGVLVIVRPGIVEMTPAAAIPLAAAVSLAFVFIILKKLSRTEPTERIVFYMVVYMTPITLVPALFVWTTPEWRHVPLLVGIAVSANLVQLGVTKAYAAADATAVMPYDFLRLPFTALVGYLAFAQVPDPYTWLGAAVIFGASVAVARREARASRVPAPT